MDKFDEIFKEERIIKQFKKYKNKLVHPLFANEVPKTEGAMEIGLFTLGHLWLYEIIEKHAYKEYLKEIIKYAISKKSALFEWEIYDSVEKDICDILLKHDITFSKYLLQDFQINQYSDVDANAKDKDHPYCHLTRLLALAEMGFASQIYSDEVDLRELLCTPGNLINSTYLYVVMMGNEKELFKNVPKWFYDLIERNMGCYYEDTNFKYYPKMKEISERLDSIERKFATNWYLFPDDFQVIISKFLYSIKIIKELSFSLYGLNGILSAVSTRIIFDNYWQTLYLIKNSKVDEYRQFVLNRMRLHLLKRDDGSDVNIGELFRQVDGKLLDPIPVNGDYFTKSVRVYADELNIKDDYDKYYEYNSEFIHASLTAVYSGIMTPCKNPEHDFHLTIREGGTRLVDSIAGIFDILNKHIDLINNCYSEEILAKLEVDEMFLYSRDEWINYSKF